MSERVELTGWGRAMPTAAEVRTPTDRDELAKGVLDAGPRGVIARGLGRSYGDAAQNAGGTVIDATGVTPDEQPSVAADGVVTVSAGTSLHALMQAYVSRGFFLPVSPGTRFVTVGGAIAADVHGKNHHADGSFINHVQSMRLALPSGDVVDITPSDELFWATAGGMGLTGVIVEATIVLRSIESSAVLVDTDRLPDLDATLAAMSEGDADYHYSAAWIDLMATGPHMGRCVLYRGDFATRDMLPRRRLANPLQLSARVLASAPPVPSGLLNHVSLRAFNECYFRSAPRRRRGELQTITRFFHPLDIVGHWNRLYGPSGFIQWQPVVPFGAESTLQYIVEALSSSGTPSFLSVLKRFGPGNAAPLSFPIAGWTISLDLPVTHGPALGQLLDDLDRRVVDVGGRIYFAKDSRMRPELVPLMYPRLEEWRAICAKADPDAVMQSDLSRRLKLR
ncbi:MAG: decaprenylphospho-beta-D-ribofuranose 2-oxidase [Acidimicrobiaceae bacterium]|jgi:decaprenylphospho-beta-D-ribofuranose 2-oxidase